MKVLLLLAALALLPLGGCAAMGGRATGERLRTMQRSPNYAQGKFRNLFPIGRIRVGRALRSMLRGNPNRVPRAPVPVVRPTRQALLTPPASGLRVTWLGHSTLLIDLDGRRFLTDPVWSRRASPSPLAGPRRFFEPPLPLAELPPLDAVVISHDHYDHLDMRTIKALAKTDVPFVVPLGVGAHLERWGVPRERITERDWWEQTVVNGVTLVATPARHGSGRGLTDRDATLWVGWALLGPRHRVYFSGDSGYSPTFREIGHRHGPFDLTLIEAGAYNTEWADFHMGPEQAVQAHRDLRGRVLLPIHWGTFVLAPHGWTEPAERVRAAALQAGVTLVIPRPGGSVEPATPPPLTQWWPANPWRTAAQAPVVSSQPAGFQVWTRGLPAPQPITLAEPVGTPGAGVRGPAGP